MRGINLVHDEILVEVKEDIAQQIAEIVKRDMKRAGTDFLQIVPVEVDIHIDSKWRKG
jgi:DNA polymerase I-like protein with 3'-5' exonuclease and polymerase domains